MTRTLTTFAFVSLLFIPTLSHADVNTDMPPDMLSASSQWSLADSAWNAHEYDDAASMMVAFESANSSDPNALEALWRAYQIYRWSRPNELRRTRVVARLTALCDTWAATYSMSDPERASASWWYKAVMLEGEGQRTDAIAALTTLTQKYPGTAHIGESYWRMAEWMRDAHQNAGAIDNYKAFQKLVGVTEDWDVAAFRIGGCYEELRDNDAALAAYVSVLDAPGNNWSWWQLASGAIDAAKRARLLGDEALCKQLASKVVSSSPTDGGWADIQRQAEGLLGAATEKKIEIAAHLDNDYETDAQSIAAGSKLTLKRSPSLQITPISFTKDDLFNASLVVASSTPMQDYSSFNDQSTYAYTLSLANPDKNGDVMGESWLHFDWIKSTVAAPDSLVVTRTWAKKDANWGEETIRIQSSAKWQFWIRLPNNQTNPNNITDQPDDIEDNGATFHWTESADLANGITISFPVEAGDVATYYPQIRLKHEEDRLPRTDSTAATTTIKLPEYTVALNADKALPVSVTYPESDTVELDEVKR